METLKSTISYILLLGIILVPILTFIQLKKRNRNKNDFMNYLVVGVLIVSVILLIGSWWGHYSTKLLMSHYGYDFEAMNKTDSFKNVSLNNLERVKNLKKDYLGVGWPFKAIVGLIMYSPYLLLVYFSGSLIRSMKRKIKEHAPNNLYRQ